MMRYQLVGKKHDHSFRIILTEKRTSPHGKMQERLGFYNPKTKEVKLEKERITYWIGKGAQASDSVWNLFVKNGVVKGAKKYIPSAQYKPKTIAPEEKKKEDAAPKKEEVPSPKIETAIIEETAKVEEIAKETSIPIETEVVAPAEEIVKVEAPAEETAPVQEMAPATENQKNAPVA